MAGMRDWPWVGIGLVAVIGAVVAPKFRNIAEDCLDTYRSNLLDPKSAYVVSSSTQGIELTVYFRAKNSYGAYVPGETVCLLNSKGDVDGPATLSRRVDEAIAELKADGSR